MTEQEVTEALRNSNPVPEPQRLHQVALEADTLFSSITERREAMLRTPLKSRQPVAPHRLEGRRRWHRKPLILVVAGLLVLLVAGAAASIYLVDDLPPLEREFPSGPTSGTWTSFGSEDGIGEGCARRLAFGHDGTAWLAGSCGLLRYDGQTWQHETDIPDLGGLVDLAVAPDGTVWLGSAAAPLYEYDGEATIAHPVEAERVAVTPDGIVWGEGEEPYSADSHLLRYDGAEWTDLSEPGSEASIGLGGDGTLWVVTYPPEWTGFEAPSLQRYRDGAWTTHEIPDAMFRGETGLWEISAPETMGPDGAIWMFGPQVEQPDTPPELREVPLIRFDGETWTETGYAIPAGEIEQMEIAPDGTVWVNSRYGVFALVGDEWTQYTTEEGMPSSGLLNFIEIGPDGAIWFGSDTALTRYMPEQ
ncbi:MAG: hypothetical protein ACE5KX_01600 [Acidimicrobiia bacterium]